MKLYLAGPITGMPDNNLPNFQRATLRLRDKGHEVVSPHEVDDITVDQTPERWAAALSNDVHIIARAGIEAVVVLPHWHTSRGAALETFIAYRLFGLPVYTYSYGSPLEPVSALVLDRAHLELRR